MQGSALQCCEHIFSPTRTTVVRADRRRRRSEALYCSFTKVANLGPLAACTGLQTQVADLGPQVADLGPLAACTGLQALCCLGTRVAELGPLTACTELQALYCKDTKVADLGPLAACTGLRAIYCDCRVPAAHVQLLQAAYSKLTVTRAGL